jgi:hypothetical protein
MDNGLYQLNYTCIKQLWQAIAVTIRLSTAGDGKAPGTCLAQRIYRKKHLHRRTLNDTVSPSACQICRLYRPVSGAHARMCEGEDVITHKPKGQIKFRLHH